MMNAILKTRPAHLLLGGMVLVYIIYFSWYTINRHNTLNSYTADLSLIDQPMWNTVIGPGGFMELTWGSRQQPRLAEHFEPVLVPLALLFFVWDDVRVLLVAQSVALALGAIPVFWIAQNRLSTLNLSAGLPRRVALVFAGVYLLSPHLQAANIADFHADPFVVTPLLFAFWYAIRQRWPWMWLWAVVAMATKETLPPLTAMLGLWLLIRAWRQTKPRPAAGHGLALMLVSSAWFGVATFLIVAPLARQYFGVDGPVYFASRFNGETARLTPLLQDPARWRYLFGLLASVGFLPLLAPELLLLGLPVLAANLLSNFPGQYSGEQHYSAPLVAALIIAAIYGARRLANSSRQTPATALVAVSLWLAGWSLGYHTLHGWTPLSTRVETYRAGPAAARLPTYLSRIPPNAVVTASAAIHPHLAHRRVIYTFPTVQEATYLLVDVTDIPGVHPNDARAKILAMLNTDWQLLAADSGLLLAYRAAGHTGPDAVRLPAAFFNFARSQSAPPYPAALSFGNGRLKLLGYGLRDDPDDGVIFRFYWQASAPLPEDLHLWPLVYNNQGRLLNNPVQTPMVAAVWYPPPAWQPGEVVVTETLPQLLPNTFHLGLAVGPDNSFGNPALRYPVTAAASGQAVRLYPGQWAQLATFQRQGTFLAHLPPRPTLLPLVPTNVRFGPAIRLTGFWFNARALRPGAVLPVVLQWAALSPPPADYTVFIHLLAADGSRVAQSDAYPTWLTPAPTSQWPPETALLDSHQLALPDNLPPGTYTLQTGLYNAQTLERLPLPDGRDMFELGKITVK